MFRLTPHCWSTPASNDDVASCTTVVMPVYNECSTVAQIATTVLAQRPVQELIIVDDASTDGTWEVLREIEAKDKRVKIVQHPVNQGKGAALRTGFNHATAPIVLIQDADLEYDPQEYFLLLGPILAGRADVVYGSRFLGGPHRVLYFWHYVGNKVLTLFSNMVTNLNLTDMETCFKAFRREVLKGIRVEENRFGFEPEVTAKVGRMQLRIFEVPISYYGRTYAEGKKINWKDGISALRCILSYGVFWKRPVGNDVTPLRRIGK